MAAAPDDDAETLSLHWQQGLVFQHPARFKALAAGRRWGKTTYMRAALLQSASERPGKMPENWHAYIAPDLQQARRVMWRPLLEAVPRSWVEKEPNQTRMEIQLVTGQIIVCLGADNPDSLRGMGFRRVVLDEYADMPGPAIWEPILLPALLTADGDAVIGGTPKGFDHFYDLWRRGMDGRPEWKSWRYPTREAPHITPAMYAALVAEYSDPRIMRQELEASFESASGTVLGHLWQHTYVVQLADTPLIKAGYRAGQAIPWHVVNAPDWIPPAGAKIYGSVDYGFGKPCAIYLHAVLAGGHTRTFFELYQRELHDHEQASRLKSAIVGFMAKGMSRPDWVVLEPVMYGSRREQGIAKSIAEVYADVLQGTTQLLQGAGGRSARLSRPQRWMAALGAAPDGLPWWQCTTACPNLIRTVKMVRWDESDPEVADGDGEDHCLAAETIVTTDRGPVTIDRVLAGDRVLTRLGWRAVERAWQTSARRAVYEIGTDGPQRLRATGNHRIWTENRGFLRVDELAAGDILLTGTGVSERCPSRQKRRSCFRRPFKNGAASATTSAAGTFAEYGSISRWCCSIVGSGAISMVRCLRRRTSIIGTTIRRTIIPTIWSLCLAPFISAATVGCPASVGAPRSLGISAWRKPCDWRRRRPCRSNARGVIRPRSPRPGSPAERSTAHGSVPAAPTRSSGIRAGIRCAGLRVQAAARSWRRIGRGNASAATLRVTTVQPSGSAAVYDLTVAEAHEFLANGLLVSNSFESLGRYFEARPHGPRLAKIDPYAAIADDPISHAHQTAIEKKYATKPKTFDITQLGRS